jgi:hypothetical protein
MSYGLYKVRLCEMKSLDAVYMAKTTQDCSGVIDSELVLYTSNGVSVDPASMYMNLVTTSDCESWYVLWTLQGEITFQNA